MTPEVSGERPYRRSRIVVRPAAPAAGSDWSLSCPAGHLYRILSIYGVLTTSAVVATRVVNLSLSDGIAEFLRIPAQGSQAASLANRYSWFPESAGDATGLGVNSPMPEVTLMPGWSVSAKTDLIDAGDAWSALAFYVVDTMTLRGPVDIDALPEMVIQLI